MTGMDIRNAQASDMTNKVESYSVPSMNTDGVTNQNETEWLNARWAQQWGYFNAVADLKSAILMKAIWNVGKGYDADARTKVILDHISGWGKDTFDDILFNMEVIKRVGGDAYAEIIRDEDGTLINLKPLDPASMKIVVDRKGIIKRYEQINKLSTTKSVVNRFEPKDIFHLSNNRLADQIHGISDIDAVEKTILAEEENFDDMMKIMHRQARPMIMFKLGTDDTGTINNFVSKMDKATNKGENIYIPADNATIEYEVIQVNVSQVIMEWRNNIRNKFYRAIGMPLIIFGNAGTTESGGKIEYLAHEQVFEKDQRYLEKQIWNQLNLKINLLPPTSLLENLQADEAKDANQGLDLPQGDLTNAPQKA